MTNLEINKLKEALKAEIMQELSAERDKTEWSKLREKILIPGLQKIAQNPREFYKVQTAISQLINFVSDCKSVRYLRGVKTEVAKNFINDVLQLIQKYKGMVA